MAVAPEEHKKVKKPKKYMEKKILKRGFPKDQGAGRRKCRLVSSAHAPVETYENEAQRHHVLPYGAEAADEEPGEEGRRVEHEEHRSQREIAGEFECLPRREEGGRGLCRQPA